MLNFNTIAEIISQLVDKVLKGNRVTYSDLNSEHLTAKDKEYIIDSLQDSEAVSRRNNAIKEFNRGKEKDWRKIQSAIGSSREPVNYLSRVLKIAAVLLIGVFAGYLTIGDAFFKANNQSFEVVKTDSVLLEYNQGKVKVLPTSGIADLTLANGAVIGTRQGDFLQYKKGKASQVSFHKIKVPYGKTFKIKLSDGTMVFMNSGSSLSYPVQFSAEANREVKLEGEAYFEVSKDVNRPFIVRTNAVNVRVLGTKFVMNSFDESRRIRTVLIEGSVALYKNQERYSRETSAILSPGQMGELDKNKGKISLKKVDPRIYMDWMEGKMIFSHKAFPEILKSLERHFNISIENRNELLGNQVFTASFEGESLEEILNVFRKNFPFEYTKINNRKIIINP